MRTLLVGYDLNNDKDYPPLYEALQASGTWWHHLDSTWLVRTELGCEEMRDQLKKLIDADDELLVIDVTGDGAAWTGFTARASDWIQENL